jgi:hypothetical protein
MGLSNSGIALSSAPFVTAAFPVGEYELSVRLQTGRYDEYLGMRRDRKLDLRLDDQRLELFNLRIERNNTAAKSLYVFSRGSWLGPQPLDRRWCHFCD